MKKGTLSQLAALGIASGLILGTQATYADEGAFDASEILAKAKKCGGDGCGGGLTAMSDQPRKYTHEEGDLEGEEDDDEAYDEEDSESEEEKTPLIRQQD